jgi:hypothetical protein
LEKRRREKKERREREERRKKRGGERRERERGPKPPAARKEELLPMLFVSSISFSLSLSLSLFSLAAALPIFLVTHRYTLQMPGTLSFIERNGRASPFERMEGIRKGGTARRRHSKLAAVGFHWRLS